MIESWVICVATFDSRTVIDSDDDTFLVHEDSYVGVRRNVPAFQGIADLRDSSKPVRRAAVNLSGNPASTRLDLGTWQGQQVREVLGGCSFPVASAHWFAYLSAYDYCWWLIGDVEPDSSSNSEAIADSLAVSC